MSKHDDGGPAYPVGSGDMRDPTGMTLLDWMAGQVLAGMFASKAHGLHFHPEEDAAHCYNVADAMLAEKRRRESTTETED